MARRARRSCLVAVAGLAALTLGTACSSDGNGRDGEGGAVQGPTTTARTLTDAESPLRVGQIGAAVAAVEAAEGGAARYFEINASPTVVNLFVAREADANSTTSDMAVVAYVYAAGALQAPSEPSPAAGPTFAYSSVSIDTARVLSPTLAQLPTSTPRLFSIVGVADADAAQYQIVVESSQGTELTVFVRGDGEIIGTDLQMELPESVGSILTGG
ncbi:MAG TPA: hypothetical protein PLV68_15980 [Ilumatobacteraceae bacterium]|nr:hypothetical protein [Ilumatobacteraceae bacterium]